jgi:hypothetical protein
MKSKSFLFMLAAWALAFLPATAQETARVDARLKFLSMTKPLLDVGLMHDKKAEGFAIATDMLSDELVYQGPARLQLLEMKAALVPSPIDSAKDEDAPRRKAKPSQGVKAKTSTRTFAPAGTPPFAWIDLPSDQGRLHLILLVTPGLGNGIIALADSPGSGPMGSNRYLNLCSFPVTVRLPSADLTIGPKGSKTARPGAKDNEYYDLQILTSYEEKEKLAYSGRVFHMNSVRKLYIISEAPGESRRISLKVVEDRDAPAKAQPPSSRPPKVAK